MDAVSCPWVSEQPPACQEERANTPIPRQKKLRSLVTTENNSPLEDVSKYVDINITTLSQDEKTKTLGRCPAWEAVSQKFFSYFPPEDSHW